MSAKRPQPTAVLVKRLLRLAKVLDKEARCFHTPENAARFRAWSNTCWQAAARLEELVYLSNDIQPEASEFD
jgi:hypothetical protein